MNFQFFLFLALFLQIYSQESFYVDCVNGEDTNTGLSTSQAFRTIGKLNSEISNAESLNVKKILLKSGCIFKEMLELNNLKFGTDSTHFEIDKYGGNEFPIFDGSQERTNWISNGNNIYYLEGITSEVTHVFFGDKKMRLAHYPPNDEKPENYVYLSIDQKSSTQLIAPASFSLTSSQVIGARLISRTEHWGYREVEITGYDESSKTISFDSTGTDVSYHAGFGFVLTNKYWMLDGCSNCFYHDSQTNRLYIKVENNINPANEKIEYLSTNEKRAGIYVMDSQFLTIRNLKFEKIRQEGIYFHRNVNDFVIENCKFNLIDAPIRINGWSTGIMSNGIIQNNEILNSGLYGILCWGDNMKILDNYISNTLLQGWLDVKLWNQGSLSIVGMGIYFIPYSGDSEVARNKVINSGYDGILCSGNNARVHHNLVNYACLTLDDGALSMNYGEQNIIENNLFMNSIGNSFGTSKYVQGGNNYEGESQGIYLDDYSHDITVQNNVVINATWTFQIHNSYNHIAKNNMFIGARSSSFYISEDAVVNIKGQVKNNQVYENLFYSNAEEHGTTLNGVLGSTSFFSKFDNNHYRTGQHFHFGKWENGIWQENERISAENLEEWKEGLAEKGENWEENSVNVYPSYQFQPKSNRIDGNLINNGNFTNDIDGWTKYSQNSNIAISWVNGNLKATISDPRNGQMIFAISPSFEIIQSQMYEIQFDAWIINTASESDKSSIRSYIIQNGDSYSSLGFQESFDITKNRKTFKYQFEGSLSHGNSRLDFELVGKEPNFDYFLSNVQLYKISDEVLQEQDFGYIYNDDIYNSKIFELDNDYCNYKGEIITENKKIELDPLSAQLLVDCFCNFDGTCNNRENANSCPSDCSPVCGNLVCEEGETVDNCPSDCTEKAPSDDNSLTTGIIVVSSIIAAVVLVLVVLIVLCSVFITILCISKKNNEETEKEMTNF